MDYFVMALDQGTTSSRAVLFNQKGDITAIEQEEFRQIYPQPGWVEHNPAAIWQSQLNVARKLLKKTGTGPESVACIGITNQRETTLLWDRATGKPVYNAIVWQCRRTKEICKDLREKGFENTFKQKTGLILDPYFAGTKLTWLLDNVTDLREKAQKGQLCFGTVDTWLIYKLTGRHLTDPSNASRTLLYNIHTGQWDDELCEILTIPKAVLPQVMPCSGDFGPTHKGIFGKTIPVYGVAGDQQAALFGQTCFEPGRLKNTYGTGCFTLLNTGQEAVNSKNGLLTTVAWDIGQGLTYALEGSVFIGGAVIQWLRDELKILGSAPESEALAAGVPDTGGVYFVPAFVGLGAPYWNPDVRGTLAGLNRGTGRDHLTRAALESIAFQSADLIHAMEQDCGRPITALQADGGASQNGLLMQFQADILGIPVILPANHETTALGAAYLAGLKAGYWPDLEAIKKNWHIKREFKPQIDRGRREQRLKLWHRAVQAAVKFT